MKNTILPPLSLLLALLLLLLPRPGAAQEYKSSNQFFFLSDVNVEPFQGRAFRYQISLHYQPADTTAGVLLLTTQVGKNEFDFKKHDKLTSGFRSNEWRTYTIKGRLVSGTRKLRLSSSLRGNGTFLFDNLTLHVQAPDSTWQAVPIKNGDFERSATPFDGYHAADLYASTAPNPKKPLPAGVTAALVPGQALDKSQALRVTLAGGTLVKLPPPYGRNAKAGRYCQLQGVKLYYETYGTGEPLLLLHGNGESIASFREQIGPLSEHYRVIAVDTRAQGKSMDTLTTTFTYELFADDMKALLDSLRLPNAHVLGWSDGGNTGLLMALKYPGYVRKLVTMGANLFPTTEAVDGKTLRQSEQDRQALAKKGDVRQRLLTLVLTEPHMKYEELAAIKAPTLVVAGEKDIIKEAHTRAIAARIPQARVAILKGATHYAPQENAAVFNQTVLEFLGGQ